MTMLKQTFIAILLVVLSQLPLTVFSQCTDVTLNLRLDNYPKETTWEIQNVQGGLLASGGPYSVRGGLITETVCVTNSCNVFIIKDSYGDGICCSYGSGSYSITDSQGNELLSGGQFGSSENKQFCLAGATPAPTCTDGIQNGDETGVDCGGSCSGCSNGDLTADLQDLLTLVNQARSDQGLAPLSSDPLLIQAAKRHADDMFNNNFLSHVGSDGSALRDRVNATGYSWRNIAENIARGFTSSQSVHNAWMNSAGHRANILNGVYEEIGLARTGNYWVQVFGNPNGSNSEPAPTCTDGIQNGDETGVDCGGSCSACEPTPTCSDGIQNGDETGIDCGGSCSACEPAPTCTDGIQNGDETGVDCGGSCSACEPASTCSDGIQNGDETGIDCGGSCSACEPAPTCTDGIQNGDETGVDCGGSCSACEPAPTCTDGIQNGDETGVDCGGSCTACEPAPTCTDGIQNGDETGVDCGGSCSACEPAPTCTDGIQNGDETGVDCGGSCNACSNGDLTADLQELLQLVNQARADQGRGALSIDPLLVQAAKRHSDDMFNNNFLSHTGSDGSTLSNRINDSGYGWLNIAENVARGFTSSQSVHNAWMNSAGHRANILNDVFEEIGLARTGNYWVQVFGNPNGSNSEPASTCTDGIQNGDETGVDCGGSCSACEPTPTCTDGIQNGDETGVDCGGSCSACEAAPTCTDGIQNGDETGVDCGGSCNACSNGDLTADLQELLQLVNQARVGQGRGTLSIDPLLVQAAKRHADDMFNNNFISHTGSDGSTLSNRINDTGYGWFNIAENVARGQTSAQQVHNAWMNSAGHRANILNDVYTEIGLARTGNSWVQVFARPNNSNGRVGETTGSQNSTQEAAPLRLNHGIRTYPNPTIDKLNVSYFTKEISVIEVQIYNVSGRLIMTKDITVNVGDNVLELEVKHLEPATYLLKVDGETRSFIKR